MKKYLSFILVSFALVSCGSLQEAGKVLRNEKTQTTDEFLVKKRDPLVFPPDYDKLPKPGSINNQKKIDEEKKLRKILKASDNQNTQKNKSSSVEESIIDQIKK